MSATIDTGSEPGSWAETLASPSCKIRSVLSAAGSGLSIGSPVNSPAASANQGGGHFVNHSAHEVHYGE